MKTTLPLLIGALLASAPVLTVAAPAKSIAIIDVTDLYHPPQDRGDNFDLLAAYALPGVDLKAVVFDCTGAFRAPKTEAPGLGLAADENGPREPGFIPVWQLNYLFNRDVPCAAGPFTRMQSPRDPMRDVSAFQQQGIELILKMLKETNEQVHILSFGSARPIAAAYNRDPKLFRKKLAKIHLCAGATSPDFLEWNVALDPNAIVCLLRSGLPVALYPCAADNDRGSGSGPQLPVFSYDSHNTYYRLTNLAFVSNMEPRLRRYIEFAFGRAVRIDFLRALDEDSVPPCDPRVFTGDHSVWETAVWICATNRRLVRHADGTHEIVQADEVRPLDTILPNELRPCQVRVRDNGLFELSEASGRSNFELYYRGDPHQNETALREALPRLYLSFKLRP